MRIESLFKFFAKAMRQAGAVPLAALLGLTYNGPSAALTTTTTLADTPVFASANVPGNMLFDMSVEYPTAISVANLGNYSDSSTYLGYFDPAKCYSYQYNTAPQAGSTVTGSSSYFYPTAFATGTNGHTCSGKWSGNFMNWATMQTIDPFRWALTGGYRSVDQTTYPQTILEKAWGASFIVNGTRYDLSNFPYRGVDQGTGNYISLSLAHQVTPFTNWPDLNIGIAGNGNTMLIAAGSGYTASTFNTHVYDLPSNVNGYAPTQYENPNSQIPNTASDVVTWRVFIRVSVCDTSVLGTLGLESNCVAYGNGVYKPQGLIQQYANQIKYGVISYLNTANCCAVQGAVLREPMEFVGPTYPVPLSSSVVTNPTAEWYSTTGVMKANPDTATASASNVQWSGVMNYINKFGEYGAAQYLAGNSSYPNDTNIYMTYDRVSELYYAGIRYFENLGNVPQWLPQSANGTTSVQLDGFPAVTTWTDPIAYSCQKNFILGIGDDHYWTDWDVGGSTLEGQTIDSHSPVPPLVASDTLNQANTWLYALQNLEGITQTPWWYSNGQPSTQYIAGLAYGAHVTDIRPDLTGTQTISTYWVDVAEDEEVENLNPYYLAAKYGGFTVPSGYSITNTTPLPLSEYDTTNGTIVMNGNHTHPLPDNYFEAGNANAMVTSLTQAFSNIANAVSPYSTSFSLSTPVVATGGEVSFSTQYSSVNWDSVITASTLTLTGGTPALQQLWVSSGTLQTQLAGTGWQAPYSGGSTGRNVATWNGSAGVPFEYSNLTSAQQAALVVSSYSPNTSSTQYLSYLRGDTSNQVGSTSNGSTQSLRARALLLGDIVDAGLLSVGTPNMAYSEANNPGYTAFTTKWTTTTPRPTMVYAGANDGMLHGFVGSSGAEQFAYVPSALFQGPSGTPLVNGLAALGNPSFAHHFYVDATPGAFDIDFTVTNGTTSDTASSSNWHTVLIGGLGKGGASFYALDVTNPAAVTSETKLASNVLWEFTDSTMGYSFATPIVVKTAQYGWVVIFTSGYDNADGYGYLYIVNPTNGALLQKIKTPSASSGMTQASAYVQDYTNYTADSVYVGDLSGQLWRFDLTETTGNYPAPTLLATLTDGSGNAQPVTSAPLIEIHPTTRERYVLLGTGRLLSTSDVTSTQIQTFYAIIDGTASGFSAVTTATTRSNLVAVPDITAGVTVPTGYNGWYYDLPSGYRVISEAVAYNGVVAFSSLAMSTDPCSPQGTSEVYAVNYATGVSVINSTSSTTPAAFASFSGAVNDLKFVSTSGVPELIAGTTGSSSSSSGSSGTSTTTGPGPYLINTNLATTSATRLLNWREIPTAE